MLRITLQAGKNKESIRQPAANKTRNRMGLQKQIELDFLAALKTKNETALSTLRMLKAAIVNKKIEKLIAKDEDLPDEEALKVVKSEIKKRKDSIEAYSQGGRDDLANKEKAELAILEKYLPAPLGEDELRQIISEAIRQLAESDASSLADFGKVMGLVMKKTAGAVEGPVVSQIVREELNK